MINKKKPLNLKKVSKIRKYNPLFKKSLISKVFSK